MAAHAVAQTVVTVVARVRATQQRAKVARERIDQVRNAPLARTVRGAKRTTEQVAHIPVAVAGESGATVRWFTAPPGEKQRTPFLVKWTLILLLLLYIPFTVLQQVPNLKVLPGFPLSPTWGQLLSLTVPDLPSLGGEEHRPPRENNERWGGQSPWGGASFCDPDDPDSGYVPAADIDATALPAIAVPVGEDEAPWLSTLAEGAGKALREDFVDPDNIRDFGYWLFDLSKVIVGAATAGFLGSDVDVPEVEAYESSWTEQRDAYHTPCPEDVPGPGGSDDYVPADWGDYQNGRLPVAALASLDDNPGHLARPDAAAAFNRLNAAYKAQFGRPISVTDSYRTLEGQLACERAKGSARTGGGLCAVPGTSNHGWGTAVDLGDGVNRFGTATHEWMFRNAPAYGWVLPDWAQRGGSKPEPWHFEYRPQSVVSAG